MPGGIDASRTRGSTACRRIFPPVPTLLGGDVLRAAPAGAIKNLLSQTARARRRHSVTKAGDVAGASGDGIALQAIR